MKLFRVTVLASVLAFTTAFALAGCGGSDDENAWDGQSITFGALFGSPTLTRTVTSTSQPIRRLGASLTMEAPSTTSPTEGTLI